ncbi:Sugar O-acyltransferase, sialic acid O-acetyltransferase NeuD family [uncultured Alphaproteobacteria bacterium]|uniref:Sugar O-acyltransferase, sialic acid O-acetyltransferase NeuD family n=1 Tax=uncultured Alphaproteobacteria bacterium TaxID=91750 RepID=A0A212KDD7_9PROT|nr:Sugar O-acyltransferase, sialic acid O-acetyltransferase NeuD family [uncultured Alphaproteobacteria bacterium]
MSTPLIVIGAGGHGRVVADLARAAGFEVTGFLDPSPALRGAMVDGLPVLGDDAYLASAAPGSVLLANGVGGAGKPEIRRAVFLRFAETGHVFPALVHPRAHVSGNVALAQGCQVMAGATLQTGVQMGANALVNTGAVVDHDCRIGAHAQIAPGAVLCGGVTVDDGAHVGAAACVIQCLRVGAEAMVAAGTVVIRDVPPQARVAGVPARTMG